jgi:hypothetical protein
MRKSPDVVNASMISNIMRVRPASSSVITAMTRMMIGCQRSREVDVKLILSTLMESILMKTLLRPKPDILMNAVVLEIPMRRTLNDPARDKALTVLSRWALPLLRALAMELASLQRLSPAPPHVPPHRKAARVV